MRLACKVTGHKWNKLPDGSDGCKCTRCGERRNEGHDWHFTHKREDWAGGYRKVIRGQFYVCSVCDRWETLQSRQERCAHDWDGCKCRLCGSTRDEGHDWDGCKCKRCGKTRYEGHRWQGNKCSICGKTREQGCRALGENGRHAFKQQKGCHHKCAECGHTTVWHEFRNGTCITCGVDESEHYCELILSGKVRYDAWEHSPLDGSHIQAIDHVRSVGALRRIALTDKEGIYSSCKMSCARKLGDIAKAGGANSHKANLALRELVLKPDLGWDTPMVASWITEPSIASDPKIVEAVRRVEKASVEYDNAMIAMDSGIGRSG